MINETRGRIQKKDASFTNVRGSLIPGWEQAKQHLLQASGASWLLYQWCSWVYLYLLSIDVLAMFHVGGCKQIMSDRCIALCPSLNILLLYCRKRCLILDILTIWFTTLVRSSTTNEKTHHLHNCYYKPYNCKVDYGLKIEVD